MKTKAKCSPLHGRRWGLLLVLGLVLVSEVWGRAIRMFAEEVELSMQEISYTTEDRVTIYGSWIVPQLKGKKNTKSPVVILLHDYG